MLLLRYCLKTFVSNLYFSLLLSMAAFVIPFFTEDITEWNVALGLRFVAIALPILFSTLGVVVSNAYTFRSNRSGLILYYNLHYTQARLVAASFLSTLPISAAVLGLALSAPLPGMP